MKIVTKSLSLALGLSLCGVSGYLLYLLLKKEDDDEDSYDSTFIKTTNFKTVELKIPTKLVRAVIGRGGKNIKQIQEQSNARINFKQTNNNEDICLIKGTLEACIIAENLIQEFITKQPIIETEDLWLAQQYIPKIIGRSGDRIHEIIGRSGAKLTIDNNRVNIDRRITIMGTKQQISIAKSLIDEIIDGFNRQQTEIAQSVAKREPRLPSKINNNNNNNNNLKTSPKSERISPIPGQPDAQFEVYVSAMIDPSRFWLQIVGPKATELDILVDQMTEYYRKEENRDNHILDSINKGDLVAAVFQYDSKWYRAEILNIDENNANGRHAELYYVDYGDTDLVAIDELYELRTDFLRLHFQAIECFLARVEPSGGGGGGDTWSVEAVDKFEEWTHVAQWKKLSAKINGYSVREKTRAKREGSPVPGVDLFDVDNDKDVDIAQELVNHGYAVFKKETDFSRVNSRATSVSNVSVASSS